MDFLSLDESEVLDEEEDELEPDELDELELERARARAQRPGTKS